MRIVTWNISFDYLPLCSFAHACEGRSLQAGTPEIAIAIHIRRAGLGAEVDCRGTGSSLGAFGTGGGTGSRQGDREPPPTAPFLSSDSSSSTLPPLSFRPHLHHPRHLLPLVHRRFQLCARGLQLCGLQLCGLQLCGLQLRGRGLQLRGGHFQLRAPPPPAS
uniref:Uncharacterized protein n=1 Tax=Ananas comosus var. bracteatus TaxID=296719 RepID=A0A6V7NI14_ANACO|nr:unnamed protein product [Ananas comosus var. bracteatus]